jgi:hypothetical protein
MPKKIAKHVGPAVANVQLNQWCIEMAVRWPVKSFPGYGGAAMSHIGSPAVHQDEDVIGRAKKIRDWVLAG